MEGFNELLEIQLSEPLNGGQAVSQLQQLMPGGITIKDARVLARDTPSLGKSIQGAEYRVELSSLLPVTSNDIHNFLALSEVFVVKDKKGKIKNI